MLKGSALSLAILVVPTMLDLPTFVARLIQMDCVRIVVTIRKRRSDGEMRRWGDGEMGVWELGIVAEIGNTELFTPTLAHLWKLNFVHILSINDLR